MPAPLVRPKRAQTELGNRLRLLRKDVGLDQNALAERAGMSQAKVSRIETSQVPATVDDVERLARALGVSEAVTAELRELATDLHAGLQSWRTLFPRGFGELQLDRMQLEARASVIRTFQMAVVPGLVQTTDYARAIHVLFDPALAENGEDIATSRLRRQEVLYNTSKRFEFIVTEGALRARVAPVPVLLGQLDRLTTLVGFEHISLGVLMTDVPPKALPVSSFDIFDEDMVTIETFSSRAIVREHEDVARYVQAFAALRESAYHGADMVSAVRGIASAIAGR